MIKTPYFEIHGGLCSKPAKLWLKTYHFIQWLSLDETRHLLYELTGSSRFRKVFYKQFTAEFIIHNPVFAIPLLF
jgi:hypothetical protein